MPKSKTVKIDDKEFTIKEMSVKVIRTILETAERAEEDDFFKEAETLIPQITGIKLDDIEEMAPSEIKILWKAFLEVNADFLSAIERLGIKEAFISSIQKHLTDAFADLLNEDMAEP
jgi:hypothetical protein